MTEKRWHCVYTKAGCEKRVTETLRKKGFESYCPQTNLKQSPGERKKTQQVALFKTYVFVRMSDDQQKQVSRIDGILSFVHWMGSPVVLKENEVNLMKNFLAEHSHVRLETSRISTSEMARIITGPAMEITGNAAFAFTNPVKIILPTLGYAILAETEVSNVEMIGTPAGFNTRKERRMATT